jgi:2-keto-3-deoxy-L-rhamnonate aldolase RhmA
MTALMRPNPVRANLQAGGTAYGTMAFEFFFPGLMAILAEAGADFVLLDTEHSGVGIGTIKAQIAASRGLGIVPMVRVPGCHYHLIAPVLDAGAVGIMVPMVETAAQAQQIASWCPYRPQGVRGVAFGMPHDDYGGGDVVQKLREANERTHAIALIETAAGIASAEQIMAVDGNQQHGHSWPVGSSQFPRRGRPAGCRVPRSLQAGRSPCGLGRNRRGVAGTRLPCLRLWH